MTLEEAKALKRGDRVLVKEPVAPRWERRAAVVLSPLVGEHVRLRFAASGIETRRRFDTILKRL